MVHGVHALERPYMMQCSQFNLGSQRRSSLCDYVKTTPALESVLAHKSTTVGEAMGNPQAPTV
jgi:hypothetical protein